MVDLMRSQCAVYVDAGYLLAATATRVTGTSLRSSIDVNHGALIESLMEQARADSGLPLLRVNWYDAGSRPGGLPDYVQRQIGAMPRVKLRLGRRSPMGEQKGVDLRIGLDLVSHARQRVVDVMYLVTGDDDLSEAVEEAQNHGVEVSLLVVPDQAGRPIAVAQHLHREADGLLLIDADAIDTAVHSRRIADALVPRSADDEAVAAEEEAAPAPRKHAEEQIGDEAAAAVGEPEEKAPPPAAAAEEAPVPNSEVDPASGTGSADEMTDDAAAVTPSVFAGRRATTLRPPPSPPTSSPGVIRRAETNGGEVTPDDIDAVARRVLEGWCQTATPRDLVRLKAGRPGIPGDLDRALLLDLATRVDVYDISESVRIDVRARFWSLVDRVKVE